MDYGLIVKSKHLDILDQNNIEYTFWDGFDLFSDDSYQTREDKFEIVFDTEGERDNAVKLLKLKK